MNRILVYGMTSNKGGIESFIMNEMALLDKSKAMFDFIVDFPEMCYSEEVKSAGSNIHFIPAKSKKLFTHLKAFYKVLKEHPEYKKVYFNILDAGAAVSMTVPFIMGRKIIVHSHNGDTEKKTLHKFFKPFIRLFADKKLACSTVAASFMFGNKNVDIIPNSIDTEKYIFNEQIRAEKRKELGIKDDEFAICFVGRLSSQKNVPRLLEIFKEVYLKKDNAVLLVVGTGEDAGEIHNLASVLGIEHKVKFLGSRDDVPYILMASDTFVMTSVFEGLSVVAVEAQASGLPCVFSDGMSEETKLNSNVCFVPLSENSEKWADIILSTKNLSRITDISALQKAGYDRNAPSSVQKEFLEYLYQK